MVKNTSSFVSFYYIGIANILQLNQTFNMIRSCQLQSYTIPLCIYSNLPYCQFQGDAINSLCVYNLQDRNYVNLCWWSCIILLEYIKIVLFYFYRTKYTIYHFLKLLKTKYYQFRCIYCQTVMQSDCHIIFEQVNFTKVEGATFILWHWNSLLEPIRN